MHSIHRPQPTPEYDVIYTAAMERDYIRSQQKPAPAEKPALVTARTSPTSYRSVLAAYLSTVDGWRSIKDMCLGTGLSRKAVLVGIQALSDDKFIERQHPQLFGQAIYRGRVQRYRWIQPQGNS